MNSLTNSLVIQIVNDTSARLDMPNEIALPIDANHKTMCKFPTADCQIYRPVWRALRDLVNDALLTTPPPCM